VYAGGEFYNAGGDPNADRVAQWSSAGGWSSLGSGTKGDVYALAAVDSNIYAGGDFTIIGGKPSYYFAQYAIPQTPQGTGSGGNYSPGQYSLLQNYPNPFNPTTTIGFRIADFEIVTLKIYNVLGQEVASVFENELLAPGEHQVKYDASYLSSGVYFYRLSIDSKNGSNAYSEVKKMILMR